MSLFRETTKVRDITALSANHCSDPPASFASFIRLFRLAWRGLARLAGMTPSDGDSDLENAMLHSVLLAERVRRAGRLALDSVPLAQAAATTTTSTSAAASSFSESPGSQFTQQLRNPSFLADLMSFVNGAEQRRPTKPTEPPPPPPEAARPRTPSSHKPSSGGSSGGSSQPIRKESLEYWNVPPVVQAAYARLGVRSVYAWQIECLEQPGVFAGTSHLVYSAPTSSGKSLVAEILALRTLLQARKRVLLVLPFVSLVLEKVAWLEQVLAPIDRRVEGFYANKGTLAFDRGGDDDEHCDVAVCTFEKANGLLNRLMSTGSISTIGAVIIDEIHMLGEQDRGYLLELLISKLLYLGRDSLQIIGMSATLPNIGVFRTWLPAQVYTTDYRPTPLQELVKVDNKLYDREWTVVRTLEPAASNDPLHVRDRLNVNAAIAFSDSWLYVCVWR